ncbi:pyridoxamine 5'-phosphate oxidase-related FMN- binding [Catenulispora acidiphila DSM 44928]|uniref:Pyridoxamine 5'-phosphate oxidase-related FMN-binding n=1 Tax=Catenulispora acidiphila (strain DSM 44928 / JCM 14897 / NBRC 102108 / NRRL B-24433 / ID139908) TaxID=479433 RepID=C7QGR3_CATAD|nr:TIGR03618 family F420-dependent PPOX class oxidoreductase [Catenulispora acidiphila]ACU74943.1 pyridoxamine 5'-phosphate oxidase-related FMN- binding [Catenulispora acidiphila DSM 44928]
MKLDPEVSRILDAAPLVHLATLMPDGAPHSVTIWAAPYGDRIAILTGPDSLKARNMRRDPRVALSLTPNDNPFQPVAVRGRVVEWIEGDAAWEIIDPIAMKYLGRPYDRSVERVVLLIEPERQTVGVTG